MFSPTQARRSLPAEVRGNGGAHNMGSVPLPKAIGSGTGTPADFTRLWK